MYRTTVLDRAPLASPWRDSFALGTALVGAVVWVKIFEKLAQNGFLDQKLSRKLVHISSGPLFILTWPLFSADPAARLYATLIPILNALRLLLVGSGAVRDPGTVKSVSREGDRQELLRGPLYYCLVLIAGTVLYWRESPIGILALALMCGGDGLADIVGRRFGSARLPFNPDKSWAGSLAMLLGGTGCAYALITVFCSLGYITCPPTRLLGTVCIAASAATCTEALPISQKLDDNISGLSVAECRAAQVACNRLAQQLSIITDSLLSKPPPPSPPGLVDEERTSQLRRRRLRLAGSLHEARLSHILTASLYSFDTRLFRSSNMLSRIALVAVALCLFTSGASHAAPAPAPGPASYAPKSAPVGAAAPTRRGRSLLATPAPAPGPSSYAPQSAPVGAAAPTRRGRSLLAAPAPAPGPSSYAPKSAPVGAAAPTRRGRGLLATPAPAPGPSSYAPKSAPVGAAAPTRRGRSLLAAPAPAPGPSSYAPKSAPVGAAAPTRRGRSLLATPAPAPGPSSLAPKSAPVGAAAPTRRGRSLLATPAPAPGPASYAPKSAPVGAAAPTRRGRSLLATPAPAPGPSAYAPKTAPVGAAAPVRRGRSLLATPAPAPGPSAYAPKSAPVGAAAPVRRGQL
ncbi:hypothetical protein WJX74_003520 [Apatococcus lobatus]|uniref:phytol kinase n=1 Tax=Apatococcus lobatus TaxID=904363 RepID=A0AAW1R148_9CHLO